MVVVTSGTEDSIYVEIAHEGKHGAGEVRPSSSRASIPLGWPFEREAGRFFSEREGDPRVKRFTIF